MYDDTDNGRINVDIALSHMKTNNSALVFVLSSRYVHLK
jgi:hypothetical protein